MGLQGRNNHDGRRSSDDVSSEATATPVGVTVPDTSTADIVLRKAATIDGTVMGSGQPVDGIGVYAYDAGTTTVAWEASTGTNGSISLPNLASGSYDLYYFAPEGNWKSGRYKNAKSESKATPVKVTPPATKSVQIEVFPES
jgi:hypothetical protein